VQAVFDYPQVLDRVGGDIGLLAEVITLFLEDGPQLMSDIRHACAAGDPQALYRLAHTLKGSAANFDAHEVMAFAQQLEVCVAAGNQDACGQVVDMLGASMDRLCAALGQVKGQLVCAS
jgi:HPt (histidine-containing phosphotransfer) domain-containing protein